MSDETSRCRAIPLRFRNWLAWRQLPVTVAAVALLLALPSVWGDWDVDDHVHRAWLLGSSKLPGLNADLFPSASAIDMFSFVDGDPGRTARLMDIGVYPWWTLHDLRLSFFRPLAALTHWVDYSLWPDRPTLMHAQSLLWLAACVAAAAFLYRRLMGLTWVAGLAALLYAIDDAHSTPASWLANRNALLAALFGILAIIAHDRWRRDGWWAGAAIGPLLLVASLLSAEAGVATIAYITAHVVFLDRGTWRRRVMVLVPYVTVALIWRIVYVALGYGTWGSGFYIEPVAEPLRFAAAVLERGPILLLGQLALPPTNLYMVLSILGAGWMLWLAALLFLALTGVLISPVIRHDQLARFWALGMILSLPPICAVLPMDRLLLFLGLGAFGLLSRFFVAILDRPSWNPTRRWWRVPALILGVGFFLIHGIVAPIALPLRAGKLGDPSAGSRFVINAPMDSTVEQQAVVVVNSPSVFHALLCPFTKVLDGQPAPRFLRCLSPSWTSEVLTRLDERTLVLRPEGGYLAHPGDQLFRGKQHAMALGERVELTGLTVVVTALTDDGRPAEATFQFHTPLEHPSLRWLQWRAGSYQPFILPAVGQSVSLSTVISAFD